MFGRVLVPTIVQEEVERGEPRGFSLAAIPWVEIRTVTNVALMAELAAARLDPGEAAALSLALEVQADYLLVDERLARRVAAERGQRVVGLLGVLVAAKRSGVIAEVREMIEAMQGRAGFRASPALVREVLESVGEAGDTG